MKVGRRTEEKKEETKARRNMRWQREAYEKEKQKSKKRKGNRENEDKRKVWAMERFMK